MAFIPNVQCRKHKGEKAIIEIRPCSSKQCLKLLCLLKDNFLQQCLKEDDIKEPKIDNVQETLQHFFPTIRKHDIKLNKYIQKGALEEVIKLVQECLAEEKAPLHEQNEQSNIVLELCNDDQLGLFKMLPEDKEDLCKTERQGCNLLHLAVMHDKKAVIAMIFYAGFWPELQSGIVELDGKYFGYTPRRIAEDLSINGNSSVLEIFDYYDECYSNLPLLHRACLRGSLCFAHYLINERCHKIIEKDKVNEATCLTYARASGNKDLVQYLLKKGANHAINDKMNTFHNSQITDILHDCIDQ